LDGEFFDLDHRKQLFDCFRTHLGDELARMFPHQLAITLISQELALLKFAIAFQLTRIDDDVRLEVEHLFQFAQWNVEQVADTRRQALEEPDVRARTREINVTETLATHFRLRHFDAAFVADHTTVLHALVLAAETLPIRHRTENARAEQPITLGFERAIVDRFRFGYFAVRPLADLFR